MRRLIAFIAGFTLAGPALLGEDIAGSDLAGTNGPTRGGPADAGLRIEARPVASGAEILTIFAPPAKSTPADIPNADVPLVSILRDTLGDDDPKNDRLRYVWVLTSAHPSVFKRAAAAIPFFYFSPNLGHNADATPGPVLDLAHTSKTVWTSLGASLTQVLAIDSNGALIRSATRRYRINLADQRRVHLVEGLALLSELENSPEVDQILTEPEMLELQARLMLAGKTLGGLVTQESLPDAYFNQRQSTDQARGHNWELLRQRAEANGLYFDPMGMGTAATHALLWIAREEAADAVPWNDRFLDIANPYRDERILNWDGYSEVRYFDAEGRPVGEAVPGGTSRELIPLGLYSLDYPKVPLLLVDFRDSLSPKRREMISHASRDVVTGILGISRYGNWPYLAGSWAWNFFQSRRGVPTDRNARLEAYSQARRWLSLDRDLDPELHDELMHWLDRLAVNPLEDDVEDETGIARRQYAALMRYAEAPNGLAKKLAGDREAEMRAYNHKPLTRVGLKLAQWTTLGIYRHHEPQREQGTMLAELDRHRRADHELRMLESVTDEILALDANIGTDQQVAEFELAPWQREEINRSLDALAHTGITERSTAVVQKILLQTNDEHTRMLCLQVLNHLENTDDAVGE